MLDEIKIQDIQTKIKKVPLKHPFITALHEVDAIEAVQVKIILSDGKVGIGAATPNEKVTGDNLEILKLTIDKVISPQLLNKNLVDFNQLLNILNKAIVHQTPAKAAVEIALQNARSSEFDCSLVNLLGGKKGSVETDYTISIGNDAQMVKEAKNLINKGFTSLKIKLGDKPVDEDIKTIEKIAAAIGPKISLRIDCNQAWNRKQTLLASDIWSKDHLNIAFIEQPVPKDNLYDMEYLTTYCKLPIMADESVASYQDATNLVSHHACDYINIKLMKTGGLSEAVKIDNLAQANGIRTMVGCMIEPIESISAAVAFALAHENVKFIDLDSIFMAEQDPDLTKYVSLDKNKIELVK